MTNAYDFFPHGDSRHYWYAIEALLQSGFNFLESFYQDMLDCSYRRDDAIDNDEAFPWMILEMNNEGTNKFS